MVQHRKKKKNLWPKKHQIRLTVFTLSETDNDRSFFFPFLSGYGEMTGVKDVRTHIRAREETYQRF